MKKILAKVITGSHSYGTNVETSDVDTITIFKYEPDIYFGHYEEHVTHGKGDYVEYEIGKFISMLCTGNPTAFQVLFVDDEFILKTSKEFDYLRSIKDKFITKKCRNSFVGYANQQIMKAKKADVRSNWEKKSVTRKQPIDFCWVVLDKQYLELFNAKQGVISLTTWLEKLELNQYDIVLTKLNHSREGHQLFFQNNTKGICVDDSCDIRVSETPINAKPIVTVLYNSDAYSMHCKEYREYEQAMKVRNRLRYLENEGVTYDVKNMMHTIRLLAMAEEISLGKGVFVNRKNIDADYLISIRKGKIDVAVLFNTFEERIQKIIENFKESNLPEEVILDVNQLIINLRKYDDRQNESDSNFSI